MGHRIEQVNALIHRELNTLLAKELFLSPATFVTITKVETAPDLEEAAVFLSIFPADQGPSLLKKIEKRLDHFHYLLKKKVSRRRIPRLRLVWDKTEENASKIDALIDKIEHEG